MLPIFIIGVLTSSAFAQELPLKLGAFIDTYYAYDSNRPKDHEREYTTQPVRHSEFNINLAYVDAVIKQEKTRGRLALQFGQSVTKNTIGEPTRGKTSGPQDAKIFQEAYVGKKISEKTWIDAGIFLGNIGAESWISKDNWTYTRALNLDYVPYYSAGVRLEHFVNERRSFQVQVLNGWQNMSENNEAKALGFQFKEKFSSQFTFTYNNFLGDEKVVPNPQTLKFHSRFRGYHNLIAQYLYTDRWQYLFSFDVGHQSQQNNDGVDAWIASAFTIRYQPELKHGFAFRAEYYADPHEANIVTRTKNGFQVIGASFNYDQKIDENALWRTEIRGFNSKDKIYPNQDLGRNRLNGVIVTSLSLWI